MSEPVWIWTTRRLLWDGSIHRIRAEKIDITGNYVGVEGEWRYQPIDSTYAFETEEKARKEAGRILTYHIEVNEARNVKLREFLEGLVPVQQHAAE